jgi:hypothetical protein
MRGSTPTTCRATPSALTRTAREKIRSLRGPDRVSQATTGTPRRTGFGVLTCLTNRTALERNRAPWPAATLIRNGPRADPAPRPRQRNAPATAKSPGVTRPTPCLTNRSSPRTETAGHEVRGHLATSGPSGGPLPNAAALALRGAPTVNEDGDEGGRDGEVGHDDAAGAPGQGDDGAQGGQVIADQDRVGARSRAAATTVRLSAPASPVWSSA